MLYTWHTSAWNDWKRLSERLPHALMIRAGEGEEAFEFARHAAQSLLCERPLAERQPCGKCAACNWFEQGNHPDYRLVVPDSFAEVPPEEGADAGRKEKRSEQIRVQQIRGLSDFLAVGTHRAGWRVILLYPADTMNANTQNALLKSLEEPPPGTIFLLATAQSDRLLATVRSRCLNFVLPLPDSTRATAWLETKGVARPEIALAGAGGDPVAALLAQKNEVEHSRFLEALVDPRMDPIALAERIQRVPLLDVVGWLQRWSYDLLCFRVAGRIRYHLDREAAIARVSRNCEAPDIAHYVRQLAHARAAAQHPLNSRLFVEDLLLQYQGLALPV
jgi:DNA polymerase III subunit delta'